MQFNAVKVSKFSFLASIYLSSFKKWIHSFANFGQLEAGSKIYSFLSYKLAFATKPLLRYDRSRECKLSAVTLFVLHQLLFL